MAILRARSRAPSWTDRVDAFDSFDPLAHKAQAKPAKTTQQLVPGLNDTIDLWIEKDLQNDLHARLIAAGAIQRDPVAMTIIEELEPKARACLDSDFEAVKEKARQSFLACQQSLGMGR